VVVGKCEASFVPSLTKYDTNATTLVWFAGYSCMMCGVVLCLCAVQSSTEVSTLADDYSSAVSVAVSDKLVPSSESTTAASQKVSADDNHPLGGWSRADDEAAAAAAAAARNTNTNKPHLVSDVDSEGIYRPWAYTMTATNNDGHNHDGHKP